MQEILQKTHRKHIQSAFAALLAAALLLSGCKNDTVPSNPTDNPASSSQTADAGPAGSDGGAESGQTYYKATEKIIPDPGTGFADNPENQGKNYFPNLTDEEFANGPCADARVVLSPVSTCCADGRLYFLYDIMYKAEGSENIPYITGSFCLGILDAPYEQWEYRIFSTYGLSEEDPSSSPSVQSIAGAGGDGIYLLLSDGSPAFYSLEGSVISLREIELGTDGPFHAAFYPVDESLYVIYSDGISNGRFSVYNKDLQPGLLDQNLQNRIYGCIFQDSECLWYGVDEAGLLSVWDKPNGTLLYSLETEGGTYSDFLLTRSAEGAFILASSGRNFNGIWKGDGSAPLEKALSLSEMGYNLQELLMVSPDGDDGFTVIAYFEGSLCRLDFKQTAMVEKQVITMVTSDIYSLQHAAAAFNRQSEKYFVTLVNPFESGDIGAYCTQLQMDISAGKGPDLMDTWLVDMDGCIKNGYLEPLNDVIADPSEFWPGVCDAGETDGVLYGITTRFLLSVLSVSKSLAGDLEAWDAIQMMEAVQNSSAESLELGIDSMNIVLQYGLATRDNPQFIDYDAGVSHLAEQPFIAFLEFAKNYGDDLYYKNSECREAADYYKEGRIAALKLEFYDPSELFFASTCFQGQEVLIGMPAAQGRGVYMSLVKVCLNSNSPCKEGAREFLRYLLSKDGQLRSMRDPLGESRYNARGGFSCRRDATEILLDEYQKAGSLGITSRWGFDVECGPLSDKQLEQFWALLEDAKPEPSVPSDIRVMAEEELAPYFAGDCSAEEAAGKLHNRVQLYLDEQG